MTSKKINAEQGHPDTRGLQKQDVRDYHRQLRDQALKHLPTDGSEVTAKELATSLGVPQNTIASALTNFPRYIVRTVTDGPRKGSQGVRKRITYRRHPDLCDRRPQQKWSKYDDMARRLVSGVL